MFNPQFQPTPQYSGGVQQTTMQPFMYGNPQTIQQTLYQPQTAYPSQINRQQVMHGRVVNSAEEIMPNEVAMDGSVSLFPTRDYSRIYAKAWNSDGTITTIEFVPTITTSIQQDATQSDDLKQVVEKCDILLNKVDELLNDLKAD